MIDALGNPQSALVLGGGSDIAVATLERMAGRRLSRAVLAGRSESSLGDAVARLTAAGCPDVRTAHFDALDATGHELAISALFAEHGGFDVVFVAFGVLGDQGQAEVDIDEALRIVQTNYTGAVTAMLASSRLLVAQGHGAIVLLSSVAGERARRSNFVYGSSKAGADALAQGLGDALHGSGVHVMIVRPGFVHSKMTKGMAAAPMSATPEEVAEAVVTGLEKRSRVVYAPAKLRYVFSVLRHVPRPVFRRLPL
ncbi:MAG: decaprenylphospho-beta-D-erythro-pentofuranosid-2-ulose 2-reductase [Acidimicrobiales bacterium]